MAIFNPNVQVAPDPNYLGYSKPIETPKPDQSLGTALSGFGDVVKSTATGVDTIFKTEIENEAEARVRPEKEGFQTALETVLGKRADNNNIVGTESVATVPEDVQEGLDSVAKLKNAKAAKAFPESYYLQRLDTIAKDMRSRWGGYTDYIDQQISKITGKPIANAYMDNLIAQFKSHGEGKDTDQAKAISQLTKPEFFGGPGVAQTLAKVVAGEAGFMDAIRVTAPIAQQSYQRLQNKNALEDVKLNVEGKAVLAEQQIDKSAPQIRAGFYTDVDADFGTPTKDANGNPVKVRSLGEMEQVIQDSMSGKKPIDDTEVMKVGQAYAARVDVKKKQLLAQWTADGQFAALGAKRANEKADELLKPLSDFASLVMDNKLGPAFFQKRMAQAAVDSTKYDMFNDKDLGPVNRIIAAVGEIGGPNAAPQLQSAVQRAVDTKTGKSIDNSMQGYLIKRMGPLLTQPDPRFASTLNGLVTQVTEDAKKIPDVSLPTVLTPMLEQIDKVTTSTITDQQKFNLIKSVASPDNLSLMSKFTMDGKDKDGNYVQGRYILFGRLVSEDFAKEVKRLSTPDNQLWESYSNNVKSWFGTDLFGSDIRALQNIKDPNVRLLWNSDTKQFDIDRKEGPSIAAGSSAMELANRKYITADINQSFAKFDAIRQRVNMGLRSFEGYAKADGTVNTEAFLLNALDQNGFDIAGDKVQGIPSRIIRAIRGSVLKTQGKKLEE